MQLPCLRTTHRALVLHIHTSASAFGRNSITPVGGIIITLPHLALVDELCKVIGRVHRVRNKTNSHLLELHTLHEHIVASQAMAHARSTAHARRNNHGIRAIVSEERDALRRHAALCAQELKVCLDSLTAFSGARSLGLGGGHDGEPQALFRVEHSTAIVSEQDPVR